MNKKIIAVFGTGITLAMAMLPGCSSAPKRQMVYTDITSRAYDDYEKANAAITRGDYEKAAKYLNESYRQAVSIDKNELMCKILLSAVSFRIQFPGNEDLDLPESTETLIKMARKCAAMTDESDLYNSIANVFECRASLYRAQKEEGRFVNVEKQGILDGEVKALAKQPYYLAFLYRTKGECHNYAKDYLKAAQAYETAAEIHTKSRYLFEISYDWYLSAQVLSKAGKKAEALSSIQNALKYDRDAENSAAIAQDYMAAAYILVKDNPTSSEKEQALACAERAQAVYETAGFEERAGLCAQWIEDHR